VAHLGVVDRQDPPRPRPAVQPRNAVVRDVEVLAGQLAQEPLRGGDLVIVEQPVRNGGTFSAVF